MLSGIRRRINFASVTAGLALFFAVGGAAWASNHYVITSTKQIAPSVLKKLKGKAGPAGPQGLPGAAGANGKDGASGANGKDGQSVISTNLAEGNLKCPAGGTEFQSASGASYACNGKTGFTATLPKGGTETGSWSAMTGAEAVGMGVISFSIPLSAELDSSHVVFIAEGEAAPTGCTGGTPAAPKAAQGFLCVYESHHLSGGTWTVNGIVNMANPGFFFTEHGATTSGAGVWVSGTAGGVGVGTFAVTAP
jgi:hypothetical protein